MQKFDRSVRRHHRDRLKKGRRTYWGNKVEWFMKNHESEVPVIIGKLVDTPHPCSCIG